MLYIRKINRGAFLKGGSLRGFPLSGERGRNNGMTPILARNNGMTPIYNSQEKETRWEAASPSDE
jgi:hypothetical protein